MKAEEEPVVKDSGMSWNFFCRHVRSEMGLAAGVNNTPDFFASFLFVCLLVVVSLTLCDLFLITTHGASFSVNSADTLWQAHIHFLSLTKSASSFTSVRRCL